MPRYRTLKEIDRAGHDVRLWCFICGRGETVDGTIWMHFEERGLPLELDQARRHFPCRRCGARDALILPATPARPRPKDATGWAVTWFFAGRAAARKPGRR